MDIFHSDFFDFIKALNLSNVKYVLVGGYSVVLHGYHRTTGDMDIFVEQSAENYRDLVKAFNNFGLPLFGMTKSKFLDKENEVFTYGSSPVSIDIITSLKGVSFTEVFEKAVWFSMRDEEKVRVIHLNSLIKAKKASSRPRDLDDVDKLLKLKNN